MFSIFAMPDIVGFVGLRFEDACASAAFCVVSANIFMNSSRVSGFLVSLPDILSPLRSLCSSLYIRMSEKFGFLTAATDDFQGEVSVNCLAVFSGKTR